MTGEIAANSRPRRSGDPVSLADNHSHSTGSAPVLQLPVTHADGPFGGVRRSLGGSASLRALLTVFDLVSVTLGWLVVALVPGGDLVRTKGVLIPILLVGVAVQIGAIASQRLYLSRVSAIRSIELVKLMRASTLATLAVGTASALSDGGWVPYRCIVGFFLTFFLTAVSRGIYGAWLGNLRRSGRFVRPIIVVGTNEEGSDLVTLLSQHPELGYVVRGVTGPPPEDDTDFADIPYLGGIDDTLDALVSSKSNGVLVAASSLPVDDLNMLTRQLMRHEVHVHISSGLRGIDHRRLRSAPIAHEPAYYVEPRNLSEIQIRLKRVLDLVVSVLALVLSLPFMLMAALAVKLYDGGPVLFKQERIGRNAKPFVVYKFRTMVPDAEDRLDEVLESIGNERDSILFKLDSDPRRTGVGRVLESTSFDELPQLFNVLNGTMSLVGPRPALPSEVAKFDDELLGRFNVPPGITGLWQVEARDNPSFEAYRRLDLFYVENWSFWLDVVLLLETASQVFARMLNRKPAPAETIDLRETVS